MKSEIKQRWIEALRSGEYKQGKGRLHMGDEFCCLGVLCEILDTPSVIHQATGAKAYDGETAYLPYSVAQKCDLCDTRGGLVDSTTSLSQINDRGNSFTTIADIIEKNWKRL